MADDQDAGAARRLGVTLRRLRRQRGLAQRDLCKPLNLASHTAIVDFEAGRRIPSQDILAAYERLFGLAYGSLRQLRSDALAQRAAAEAREAIGADDGAPGGSGPPAGPWAGASPITNPRAGTQAGPAWGIASGCPVLAQIPPDLADFTGRDCELEFLRRRLMPPEAGSLAGPLGGATIVLTGPAGVGKTSLGIRAAHAERASYPDGQLFVNLHGYEDSRVRTGDALGRILRSLGVPPERVPAETEERTALYRSVLAHRRVLVVVDDVADEASARPLLPPGPGCSSVLISRSALLGLAGADRLDVREFDEPTALHFLTRVVGAERVAGERTAAAEITRLCGGLPLALRISAARLTARPHWPLSAFARYLADEGTRLSELAVGDLAVRSSLSLSYRCLTGRGQVMFRRLGLMPQPEFGQGAVAAVVGGTSAAARHDLEALTDASLLTSPAPERYRFHPLGQLFARECLANDETAEEASRAEERLLAWYDETARAAVAAVRAVTGRGLRDNSSQATFPSYAAAIDWLETELPALLAVTGRLADTAPARAVGLVEDLADFFYLRKHWQECQLVCELALTAAGSLGDRRAEASLRRRLGIVHRQRGDLGDAIQHHQAALAIYQDIGDQDGQGRQLNNLGAVRMDQDQLDDAVRCLEPSLRIFRELGDQDAEAGVLNNLGNCHERRADYREAVACLDRSLAIRRRLGDRYGISSTLDNLGMALGKAGSPDKAVACFEESLALCRETGNRYGEGIVLKHLGDLHSRLGRHELAVTCWSRAADLLTPLHAPEARELQRTLREALADPGRPGAPRPARTTALP